MVPPRAACYGSRMMRWLPSVALVVVVSTIAGLCFAYLFGLAPAPEEISRNPEAWWYPNWLIGMIAGLVTAAIATALVRAWDQRWSTDPLAVTGATLLVIAIFAILVVYLPLGPKACIQVSWDLVNSYNGGCDDPNVPVIQQGDFSDMELQTP